MISLNRPLRRRILSEHPESIARRQQAGYLLYLGIRRLFDIAGALVGCAVVPALCPLIWLANRFTSRGALFYWQERVGLLGAIADGAPKEAFHLPQLALQGCNAAQLAQCADGHGCIGAGTPGGLERLGEGLPRWLMLTAILVQHPQAEGHRATDRVGLGRQRRQRQLRARSTAPARPPAP